MTHGGWGSSGRFAALTLALGVSLTGVVVSPAEAYQASGKNGLIAWVSKASGNADIWTMRPDGSGKRNLTNTGGEITEAQPEWSPDSTKIAYIRQDVDGEQGDWRLWVMNADGTGQRQLNAPGTGHGSPSWSPDGSKIVYASADAIRVVNSTTGAQLAANTEFDYARTPMWSPTDDRIVFTAADPEGDPDALDYRMGLVCMNGAGETVSSDFLPLAERPSYAFSHPTFSPDGQRMGVVWSPDGVSGNQNVYTANPCETFGDTLVTPDAADYFGLSWSPDGTRLLTSYSLTTESSPEIFSLQAVSGGGTRVRLTNNTVYDGDPTWTRDNTPPSAVLISPSSPFSLDKATVSWAGRDGVTGTGVARYQLRYQRAPANGGFGAWSYPESWSNVGAAGQFAMTLGWPGATYCFAVRAIDYAGNASAWSSAKCTAQPLDDRSLGVTTMRWTRVTGHWLYKETATTTTHVGIVMTSPSVQAKRVAVVATKCPKCGKVTVKVNGATLGTIDLYSAETKYKQIVPLPLFALKTATITLTTAGASPRYFHIDGLGVSRS